MLSTSELSEWKQFFPFDNVRQQQADAINFSLKELKTKKFIILELGCGVGKSAIGVTVARKLISELNSKESGAYFLTTQKVLQDQYMQDFGPQGLGLMRTIKSSSNYRCAYHPTQSCAESRRILPHLRTVEEAKDFVKTCNEICPYSKEKSFFIQSQLSVTNFSYFLSETMYAGKLEPRQLLIIDEAHNIETELSKFVEIVFSEKFAKDVLKCKLPVSLSQESVIEWIKKTYKPSLSKYLKKTENTVKKESKEGSSIEESSKRYEMLDKHLNKIEKFIDSYKSENWVMNHVESNNPKNPYKKLEFKPISVASYVRDSLFKFGEKVIMMSATILNKSAFCRSIGLAESEVEFLKIDSPFSSDNKPIYVLPVGSMSASNINETLPKMSQVIKEIMSQHAKEKGILHVVNYKIANYIKENLKDDRILYHDSTNRDIVLKRHLSSQEPTVLLSPSMMEGVDLADDASRFQVLCKIPYPYLGDAVIQKRMKNDDMWYSYQTAKLIIQALGRSIRNEKDYAASYILDSDWLNFYSKYSYMFPNDFCKTVK
jgi:Rad3-related DNA helicase